MKKSGNVFLKIFSYGILACLFAGGFSLVGYLAAMVIGGDTAPKLCLWVFKTYLPWVIRITSIFTGIGLIGMYIDKQKALTAFSEKV